MTKGAVFFVSGHLDLTESEFQDHYVPQLDEALKAGGSFVVGDARGADVRTQRYLDGRGCPVTIFHMLETPRNHIGNHNLCGGFQSDAERDEEMTAVSTHDIAWVRPGRENSGTAKNLLRRKTWARLPPKERTVVPPEGGWKPKTYYAVEVAFRPENVVHRAVFYSGFLDKDGEPEGYHALWNPTWNTRWRGEQYKLSEFHYVRVLEELTSLSRDS